MTSPRTTQLATASVPTSTPLAKLSSAESSKLAKVERERKENRTFLELVGSALVLARTALAERIPQSATRKTVSLRWRGNSARKN